MAQLPYLTGDTREMFDAWAAEALDRHAKALTFAELRRGAQAVHAVLSAPEIGGERIRRLYEGAGKRAALATFFAQLSFLRAAHAAEMLDLASWTRIRRVIDAGPGTGAAGAAVALALGGPRLEASGRFGWALDEAARTGRAFGLEVRRHRGELPAVLGRPGAGDVVVCCETFRALDPPARAGLREALGTALRRGARVLVIEGLDVPRGWWQRLVAAFGPRGAREETVRVAIERPDLVRRIDRAARLDHQVLAGRILVGPREVAS